MCGRPSRPMHRVYPRGCGGTEEAWATPIRSGGLSPRVRGNPRGHPAQGRPPGSIPAGAGEPGSRTSAASEAGVYPRGCGGNRPRAARAARGRGSIPAGAGEPGCGGCGGAVRRVYPRGCGGTVWTAPRHWIESGLSPRVRGNRPAMPGRAAWRRSIPAGAGEPADGEVVTATEGVYPRGCGGTSITVETDWSVVGLSPRVRGNRRRRRRRHHCVRSIPAGAGEPQFTNERNTKSKVYPRGCGGTTVPGIQGMTERGLSPRVRGNLQRPETRDRDRGSIPAGAGEPPPAPPRRSRHRVYPRGCGGTCLSAWNGAHPGGLSPRVRGNPLETGQVAKELGSIPAGAGEPPPPRPRQNTGRVYPRGCGGTSLAHDTILPVGGLSPRVRGNPAADAPHRLNSGSIPRVRGNLSVVRL